jgi:AraC-like DNA-binding protein
VPTVTIMSARAVIFAAGQYGLAPLELCAKVGIDPALLADVDARIPIDVMGALWTEVAAFEPDIGLRLGELAVQANFTLPWQVLRTATNLREGIQRLHGVWRVINDIEPLPELIDDAQSGDFILRICSRGTPMPIPRQPSELIAAWFTSAARRATGRDVNPKRVTFEHPAPTSTSVHERIFKCDIAFNRDAITLVFAREALELPTADPDPGLAELLAHQVATLVANLPKHGAFTIEVRRAIVPLLTTGDVSIGKVAKVLGSNPRTVQRHLRTEGTSFQIVLSALQCDAAMAYLRDQVYSIAEIAALLGFSDQAGFNRAFVRWTKRTPAEFRREFVAKPVSAFGK